MLVRGNGAEERQMVGGHVDRAAPRALDPRAARPGSSRRRPRSARAAVAASRREPRVDPASEADRPRAAPHQHASVVGRAEVVEEHPPVDDRFAAGPADLAQKLRHRLGEHDVRAEVRHVPAHGPPARTPPRSSRRRSRPRARFRAASSRRRPRCRSPACPRRARHRRRAPSRRSARTSRAGCTVAPSR